jgi:predicted Zn-dependent protease
MQEIGGSHAQRDLFDQTWIDVLMKTGGYRDALPILEYRVEVRPTVAPPYALLADAYEGAGEAAKAEAVRNRAAELAAA